jgi:cytochrome c2
MTQEPNAHSHATTYGLGKWLLGGLVGGGIVLGLLIGAYAVGYHRGQDHAGTQTTAAAPAATTTTAAPTATAAAGSVGPVTPTPALVARGKELFTADSCVGCHSLGSTAGAGPGLGGVAGRTVELADGSTVTSDDAYLARSLTDPDAEIVKGYKPGLMSAAIAGFQLGTKPDDVRALVAFLKSQT